MTREDIISGLQFTVDMLLSDPIPREKIKLLGEELRKFQEGITDEKVLIGYNMAIAICNKHLGES